MKRNLNKKIGALMLAVSMLNSSVVTMANDSVYRYVNEDSDTIKNANLTSEDMKVAKTERARKAWWYHYDRDRVMIRYQKDILKEMMENYNLDSVEDVLKMNLRKVGDDALLGLYESTDEYIEVLIDINDNKTVEKAAEDYRALEGLEYEDVYYVGGYNYIDDPVRMEGNLKGIYPIFNEDSITMGCVYDGKEEGMEYRWEYCKVGENTWHEISDWNSSQWCTWYPDANDEYVVVCRLANGGRWVMDGAATWYISRPQMQKKLTGKCAVPTSDGLLFGCTSNLTKNDTDYYTSCYIWSHEKQAWITQSSYRASNCAWFKVSSLPKGTYMMYTCTEKKMPNGEKRKLSCDYYLFSN